MISIKDQRLLDMSESFEPAVPLETFSKPLRNIRIAMDGTNVVLDLIPSLVVDRPVKPIESTGNDDVDEVLRKLEEGSRPIVEDERVFRVYFDTVEALVVQEEFVELFEELTADFESPPRIVGGNGWFPFLRVRDSAWKVKLPDYQGGDSPDLHHYKFVSMETHIDLLGYYRSSEWVRNATIER